MPCAKEGQTDSLLWTVLNMAPGVETMVPGIHAAERRRGLPTCISDALPARVARLAVPVPNLIRIPVPRVLRTSVPAPCGGIYPNDWGRFDLPVQYRS